MAALNSVQSKLSAIEAENTVSRRRVHELELELESCKQDVARERTRVLETEAQHARERRRVTEEEADESERRYKVVVEEKKGQLSFVTIVHKPRTYLYTVVRYSTRVTDYLLADPPGSADIRVV
jgi:hypothetical protein